jgi:parallel beta-helix repeat protein
MNKKTGRFVVVILLVFILVNFLSPFTSSARTIGSKDQSLFTPEEEGDHFPCSCEWWAVHVALTLDSDAHWDVFIGFQYETQSTNRSNLSVFILFLYCFNRDSGKTLDFTRFQSKKGNQSIPFFFKKNVVDIQYYNCSMKGLYPKYLAYVENENKSFTLNISLNATSSSHWVAQNESNGYFPWGLGWCRYGFIPRLDVVGNITIEGTTSTSRGIGYLEHAWGNFTYGIEKKSLVSLSEFAKNLHKVLPFVTWVLSEQSKNINPLKLSTANHYGYDWAWGTFTNGWGLHFGFFHSLGGEVSLTPDGKTFWDFGNISVRYGRLLYIPETDTYSPLDLNITAHKEDKTLYLRLTTTADPDLNLINIYPRSRFTCGSGGIQTIGVIEGYYQDNEQNISLYGNCTFAIYRQFQAVHYGSVEITHICPPQGVGFSVEIISNLLGAKLYVERLRLPQRELQISLEVTRNQPPQKPPEQPYAGSTFFVGGSGSGNYTRIQDAVNHANNGDTVFVYGGEYRENIVIDKAIRLVGENKSEVLLHAGTKDGIKIRVNSVEITGFTIEAEQANSCDDAAIYLASSGNDIHDNRIIKSEWYGIIIFNSSYNVIEKNSIIDNDIGIWLCQARDNTIRYNNISLCNYLGVWLWPYSAHNTIYQNNFIGNKISNARNNDATTRNTWSHNYWDDYLGLKWKRFVDLNNDGVGIIPYRISSFNHDFSPLLEPYAIG